MLLKAALEEFATIFNCFEKSRGIFVLRAPVAIIEPMGPNEPLHLGSTLTEYFSRVLLNEKSGIGGACYLKLITLEQLITYLSGWLWIRDKAGNLVENVESWKKSWIIIGDRNGDAIFVDIESSNGAVYGSIQQENRLISSDLGSFFFTLAECMVLEKEKYGYEVNDNDFKVIEPFLIDVRHIAERNFGTEGMKSFMNFFFE